jgi:alpha-glucosidase
MPEIMAHARQRGVKVILWVFWPTLRKQIDEAFALYEKWGVAGVKIDFMDRDDQEMVKDYEVMMRKAARHRLIVNFHGTHKPTGLRRTYPNLLNREGVLGMEFSRGTKRDNPVHHVTLPFTRMLAGPMDYTPGCFHNATRAEFQPRFPEPMCQGTRAHQLAMYVVYEEPLAMVSDFPEALAGQPGMEFIGKVPTVWDDTKVPNGAPAEFVTVARRKGHTWYIGSMTNWDARDVEIDLSFLGTGEYEAKIFADGADADRVATSLEISTRRVKAKDRLNIHLASGGGWAAIVRPL